MQSSETLGGRVPRAVIFGCTGPSLTDWERAFFADSDPLGFILFRRNCETPDQIRALVTALRGTVNRADAPVLIDQEGGRVARLRPPHWEARPAAGLFAALAERDSDRALEAVRLNARLLAEDLRPLGITVDCAPVLDLRWPDAHEVIGDRAFGSEPARVAALGRAFCEGLLAGGVLPVVKHMPGHGRALCDSHHDLPRVTAPLADLERSDFEAFRLLADAPWGMTGHIVFEAIDPARPATTSPKVISEIIRTTIGFNGVLVSDDLSMKALSGGLGERAAASLAAGCDVALHCNGEPAEMEAVTAAAGPLGAAAQRRLAAAESRLPAPNTAPAIDVAAARGQLDLLLDRA